MMDELLADFLAETAEILVEADRALLRLERAPDDEQTLGVIFRALHTVKGSSAFLPLPRLAALAHAAEDVLVGLREGALAVDAKLVSVLLAVVDRIRLITDGIAATGREAAGEDGALIAELGSVVRGEAAHPAAAGLPHAGAMAAATAPQSIRVGVGVIETLMALVSELVLTRNQLVQLARGREDSGLDAALQRLSSLTSDLQEGVMKTRMQPIGNAWNKLPRLVRDLSHDLSKKI